MRKNVEKRIKALEEAVEKLQKQQTVKIRKYLGVGNEFQLLGINWKILEISEKGYHCIAIDSMEKLHFDGVCNNWQASDLRNYLNTDFYEALAKEIGEENIIPFERNLLSLDGQTEYGTCEDKVSLLTVDEYRKYRSMIPNTDDYWWWLITPWSTKCNGYSQFVAVVSPSGYIDDYYCDGRNGVRPFCIFGSSIFESGDH